jgi:hypothetical protein
MALTTPVAALDAYLANSMYDVNNSATQCAAFIEACRALLVLMPKQSKSGRMGSEQTTNPEIVAARLETAEAWYARNRTAQPSGGEGGTRFTDFSDFRT